MARDNQLFTSSKYCRHLTVQRTLVKDIHTTFSYEETADKGQMYGLISLDLTQIKPNYDAMVKGGTLRISDDGYAQGEEHFFGIIIEQAEHHKMSQFALN